MKKLNGYLCACAVRLTFIWAIMEEKPPNLLFIWLFVVFVNSFDAVRAMTTKKWFAYIQMKWLRVPYLYSCCKICNQIGLLQLYYSRGSFEHHITQKVFPPHLNVYFDQNS